MNVFAWAEESPSLIWNRPSEPKPFWLSSPLPCWPHGKRTFLFWKLWFSSLIMILKTSVLFYLSLERRSNVLMLFDLLITSIVFLSSPQILFPSRSSLPINLHVPSIASSSAMLLELWDWSLFALFPHHQRCHYPCNRKRWKNPHGVSPKVIRREYPLLVSSFVGEGDAWRNTRRSSLCNVKEEFILVSPSYSVTLSLLHGNRR